MASEDIDINLAFDSILQTEERISAEGYRQGFEYGRAAGTNESYHLGYHRGSEIGAELGFYAGVAEAWLSLGPDAISEKARRHLHLLLEQLNNYPKTNVDSVDILALADNIRSSYRRVCSLLKINASYPESSKLSF